ncbi:hypothetical protein G184_gp17 [Erwinia phage ENT90]|uniref:Uncharacterized protein n=1 Tax=Erwinia phage ENT90 TaxID=947843 RepID=F1BUP8_9CAUD|nr:hypothetical protein G184_gp17 [Erwinia phage ENT90]ADX32446.1 hypothetical protein [Erwinia phage ENT90]
MMHAGHALHLAGKLHHGVVSAGLCLHVLCGAQLFEHLMLYPAFLVPDRLRPARRKRRAVRGLLALNVLLLTGAQPLRNIAGHLFTRCRRQVCNQRGQASVERFQPVHGVSSLTSSPCT